MIRSLFVILILMLTLNACDDTLQGAGQDMQDAGRNLQDSAERND